LHTNALHQRSANVLNFSAPAPPPCPRNPAARCIEHLTESAGDENPPVKFVGLQGGAIKFYNIEDIPRMADMTLSRPKWLQFSTLNPFWLGFGSLLFLAGIIVAIILLSVKVYNIK
jgi:hypothetical protein